MASNTDYDLPRLLYPDFPSEFLHLVPADSKLIDERCVCWNCMPKLWEALANHTTRLSPSVENDRSIRWASSLQYSCDVRAVAEFMAEQIFLLSSGTLSSRQKQAIETLKDFVKKLDRLNKDQRRWRDPPDLQVLGDALSTLFYRNSLHDKCTYAWVTHGLEGELVTNNFGAFWPAWDLKEEKHAISITAFGHPKHAYIPPHERGTNVMFPKDRSLLTVGTMIRELLHMLLKSYCCAGDCQNGTVSQRKLCAYLFARTIHLFDTVLYNEQKLRICEYASHGPVFQDLARRLAHVAAQILDLENPASLKTGVHPCHCKQFSESEFSPDCSKTLCLSHCCDTYEDMQAHCQQRLDGGS